MSRINIDKNIKVAETLPSDFYKSDKVFGVKMVYLERLVFQILL